VIELRRMRWTGVSLIGHRRVAYRILVEKSEERGQLGRHRCRWDNNNNMNFQEKRWGLL
jgi:hypothetical protein